MIRRYEFGDWGFVRALWVRSYDRSTFAKACGRELYDEIETRIARRLIGRPTSTTLVACDQEAPAVLWGFVCYEKTCLHFVGVERGMRGHGVARDLLAGLDLDRTSHEGWRGLPWTPQEAW
jgi:hypothetical protein